MSFDKILHFLLHFFERLLVHMLQSYQLTYQVRELHINRLVCERLGGLVVKSAVAMLADEGKFSLVHHLVFVPQLDILLRQVLLHCLLHFVVFHRSDQLGAAPFALRPQKLNQPVLH